MHLVEHIYLRQRCFDGWVNKTILKPRLAAVLGPANTYKWDFPQRIILCSSTFTIPEKAIRFRHPDYNPDRAQKLISSSMSQHLSTCNISSKCMRFWVILLTDRQKTRAKTFTSSFVGGENKRLNLNQQKCVRTPHIRVHIILVHSTTELLW